MFNDIIITFITFNIGKLLTLHLVIILVLFLINFRHIKRLFVGIQGNTWLILLLIFAFALCLRLIPGIIYLPSNEPEWEYKMVARWMVNGRMMDLHSKMIHPIGYSFLISTLFKIGTMNSHVVSYFNAIIGSLTVIAIFLLAYLLLRNASAALVSSLIFSVLYKNIYYSRTGAAEPAYLFFVTVTLLLFIAAYKINRISMCLLPLAFLAYCTEIKIESIVYAIIFFMVMFGFLKKSIFRTIILLVFMAIMVFPSYPLYHNMIDIPQILQNISPGGLLPQNERDSPFAKVWTLVKEIEGLRIYEKIILILATASFFCLRRYKRQIAFLFSYLLINLIVYYLAINMIIPSLSLFSGSDRYIITFYPSIAILSALGLKCIVGVFRKIRREIFYIGFVVFIASNAIYSIYLEDYYNDIYEIINMRDENLFEKGSLVICCSWMEHCSFLLPDQTAIRLKYYITNPIYAEKKKYYIESSNEASVGCQKGDKEKLLTMFSVKLVRKNIFTRAYELNQKTG